MKIHPHDDVLEEFLLSLSDGHRDLLQHLRWCSRCRARLAYLPRPEAQAALAGASESGYDEALRESRRAVADWEAVLERERDEAPGLFLELLELPEEDREEALQAASRFHTWGVFELLVERSLETGLLGPARSEALGLLALSLADLLDAERYGAARISDLRARAWGHVGNACRLKFDFGAAEEAFTKASRHLKQGTGDGIEKAILLDLKASLRRAQRRFGEALRLLGRAVATFLAHGERHRAGRSLVKLSTVHYHAGRPEAGIPLLHQALELIDPEREPRLLLCARHNLIFHLAEMGRFTEAQRFYREARSLYRSFPDAWTQNRRTWVRGKIARGLGRLRQAEVQFLAARDGFVAEGVPYDTALVSLELALLYAEQGRAAELKRLAGEMLPIFASRQIHREALAALSFFQQAVEAERAGVDLVARVADFLRRAEHDPALRFDAVND